MKLNDLEIPVTPACRAALEVVTAYCSPALLNHSVRAYLWAAGYALERGINFDGELLYVSAMLHDLALVKEFDNHTLPFEEAGGHVAWVFGAAAGWPRERAVALPRSSCGICGMWWTLRPIPKAICSSSRPAWISRVDTPRLFRQACVPRCLRAIHAWAWLRSSSPRSKIRPCASRSA